jgi:phosphoribosylamine--glycine ligase
MSNIVIVDRAARGHALAMAFVRSDPDLVVHYLRGATAIQHPRIKCYEHLSVRSFDDIKGLARDVTAEFVFVANTYAISDGCVDALLAAHIPAIGPKQATSKLETSKLFTKKICQKYGIPCADYLSFNNPADAIRYVNEIDFQVVVKADGLCGGNGAFVCDSRAEAIAAIRLLMVDRIFGDAASNILIERRLYGEEFSYFGLLDDRDFLRLPMVQDYPKCGDGDTGLTCAGVGAISPHPLDSSQICGSTEATIVGPVVEALKRESLPYTGPIYFGCMRTTDGIYLLEINVRLGDPETQAMMPRIQANWMELGRAMLNKSLRSMPSAKVSGFSCAVTAFQGPTTDSATGTAHQGWPTNDFAVGHKVLGPRSVEHGNADVYWGQVVSNAEGQVITDGGRPFTVVGTGNTPELARHNVYELLHQFSFEGMSFRKDVGRSLIVGS